MINQIEQRALAYTKPSQPADNKIKIAGRVVKDYVEGAAYYALPVAIVEGFKFAGFATFGPVGIAAALLAPPVIKYVAPPVAEKVSELAKNVTINYFNQAAEQAV